MRIQIILKGWYQRKKKRVLIDQVLNDGDVMHVYHKMNGG